MSRSRFVFIILALALPVAAFQFSNQKKDKGRDRSIRTLTGEVRLPDDSLAEGAVVQIKNLKTLQIRSFITQKDGKYSFQNLSASVDFEVRATWKDHASPKRMLTVYDTRLDPIINLKLEPTGKPDEKANSQEGAK
jgi:hypothetical protein